MKRVPNTRRRMDVLKWRPRPGESRWLDSSLGSWKWRDQRGLLGVCEGHVAGTTGWQAPKPRPQKTTTATITKKKKDGCHSIFVFYFKDGSLTVFPIFTALQPHTHTVRRPSSSSPDESTWESVCNIASSQGWLSGKKRQNLFPLSACEVKAELFLKIWGGDQGPKPASKALERFLVIRNKKKEN